MSYHHLSALECTAGLCRVRTQMCVPHRALVTHLDLQQMLHCPQLRDSWFTPVCDIPSMCSNLFSPVLAYLSYSGMTVAELCACKCIGYKDLFLFINILKKINRQDSQRVCQVKLTYHWLVGTVHEQLCVLIAEIEAREACDWLRAAGFPQYAQLFEGMITKTCPAADIEFEWNCSHK